MKNEILQFFLFHHSALGRLSGLLKKMKNILHQDLSMSTPDTAFCANCGGSGLFLDSSKHCSASYAQRVLRSAKPYLFAIVLACASLWMHPVAAAPSPDLWPRWQANAPQSTQVIDHSAWDMMLKKYVVTNHPSGIYRFRYAAVSADDRQTLKKYLELLQATRVSSLNQGEQKAYWVNLYNALTVQVILEHYPVKSIMDIGISPGLFSRGPWDAKLLKIEGEQVSLNDIEHRIIRPIYRDNRLHYALNCASLGCPNLQPTAYTAANMEQFLEKGATEYINHPRGAQMVDGKLQVSSIYDWFQVDFGGSEQGVIRHLVHYLAQGKKAQGTEGSLADKVRSYGKSLRYDYDWNLNAAE
jgi:hypothetical protein